MSVILQIQYAEILADIATGGKGIQFVLTPQQCQELSEILKTQAGRILNAPTPPKSN